MSGVTFSRRLISGSVSSLELLGVEVHAGPQNENNSGKGSEKTASNVLNLFSKDRESRRLVG